MKEYLYYPGCSAKGTAKDFEISTLEVLNHLGITLKEIDDWACCGASSAHFIDHLLSISLCARTLNLAKNLGKDEIITSCAACFSRLKTAAFELERDEKLRKDVSLVLEKECNFSVKVRHVLDVFLNDIGIDAIKEKVVKPLKDFSLVTYYGCLLVRPPKVLMFDDPEEPMSMDTILASTGASIEKWPCKVDCCGASLTLSRVDLVMEVTKKILVEAKNVGAKAIAVACPLCHANLKMRQQDLKKKKIIDFKMPIIYFTQILGYSLGLNKISPTIFLDNESKAIERESSSCHA